MDFLSVFVDRCRTSPLYTRHGKGGKNLFHKKRGKEWGKTPHLLENRATAPLLHCTAFLSVVYCSCYGKVPVRCAGHSKEEKETNDENWI